MNIMKAFVCLVVLSAIIGASCARQPPMNLEAMKYSNQESVNGALCTLCEEYASYALEYVAEDKTQAQIIDLLHNSCSQLRSLETECVNLVDYYAPMFFAEIADTQPEEFCEKINLCQEVATVSATVSTQAPENGCEVCQNAVSEVLEKLKDPDTEFEIIRLLLKACDSTGENKKKCKRMVFEYGPLIISKMEKFLETSNVCSTIHACDQSAAVVKEASPIATLADE